ncbi:MAG TPA: hypothetical protein VIF57_17035 [Polyangia bacterium]
MAAAAVAMTGCVGVPGAGGGAADDTAGRAEIALSSVPADATCVQIVAAGNRTVTRNFAAAAGSTVMFTMTGLPVGQVNFTANAFAGSCPPSASAVANWVSDAIFTVTIGVSPPALVTLNLVRNGGAVVSVGFDDGPDGGATSADGGGAGGGGPAFKELMQVAGVAGAANVAAPSPFTGAFTLDSFTVDARTLISQSTGGGAGVGKTNWAASATFRAQTGLAELIKNAANGQVISSVVFGRLTGDAASTLLYKVTLTNATISSIVAGSGPGDAALEQTVTFVFGGVTFELEGQPVTTATFDITRNTGPGGGTLAPLEFVFGGPAVPPAEAVSAFIAPSEMTATSTGSAGGGVGKTTFSDASVTFPFDLTGLDILSAQSSGRTAPSAEVQLDPSGAAPPVGTYGFQNLQFHETTLTDANVTVSFGAQAFSWTFGGVTTTFP